MKTLIQNAWIVTNEDDLGDIRDGSILIEDGRITALGKDLEVPEGAEIIDADGMIAIPGFVDAHKHLWQAALRGVCGDLTLLGYFALVRQNYIAAYRPRDVAIGSYASAIELIDAGTTSVLDHAHCVVSPDHADAALDGVREAGIRGVWAYGYCPVYESEAFTRHEDRLSDARRILKSQFGSNDGLLRMGVSTTEQGLLPEELTELEIRSALDLDLKWTGHTHCGNGRAPITRGIYKLLRKGLINDLAILSHCNEFGFNDFVMMQEVGAHFSSSPDTELYMGIPRPVNYIEAVAAGVPVSLGTDTVSCMSADMFATMRLAMVTARQQINAPRAATYDAVIDQTLPVRDVFRWATINGARAMGIDHLVGSLRPGKRADITLINARDLNLAPVYDPISAIVLNGRPSNVDTVMIDGVVRKRHGKLVGIDMDRLVTEIAASHAHLNSKRPAGTIDRDLSHEVERWSERLSADT
ncbi:amidohydrolase family protein [Novosphingobium cyanobacteriorum]|uniref:Amidohydrolase family protein n=1 Tax=Novosphingobium cyanobacteriorum TaxID=3024215 RepID=A0ABT6CFT4_9SPHN|nr:amidohydrolase family protein [Novosphingobium cyanobacteriorum]MDF8332178.1 amidohydrolase family protein [Novosphingobium cyanobacteriorum]